jgi:hypothetical protein
MTMYYFFTELSSLFTCAAIALCALLGLLYILYKCGKKTRSPLRLVLGSLRRLPHPYLVFRVTWDAEHAARLRRSMEDPCLYATNPLFGTDGEGAKFPIESPSVARARWVGLPEMPNCSVSNVCYYYLSICRFVTNVLPYSQLMVGTIPYGVGLLFVRPCSYFCVVFSIG